MGHLINPLTYRLGLNIFWTSNWVHHYSFRNFSFLFGTDCQMLLLIDWLLYFAFRKKRKRPGRLTTHVWSKLMHEFGSFKFYKTAAGFHLILFLYIEAFYSTISRLFISKRNKYKPFFHQIKQKKQRQKYALFLNQLRSFPKNVFISRYLFLAKTSFSFRSNRLKFSNKFFQKKFFLRIFFLNKFKKLKKKRYLLRKVPYSFSLQLLKKLVFLSKNVGIPKIQTNVAFFRPWKPVKFLPRGFYKRTLIFFKTTKILKKKKIIVFFSSYKFFKIIIKK